ncbi:MAG: hypothetical protein NT131_03200 [Methanomassiliicoccales archaeon]|nr:hypothetical protein [Methanomassiliicoccales archaeon]
MDILSAISVFMGAMSALLLMSMRALPQRWARMYADASREKGRPKWAWLTIVGSLIGIIIVWFLHFTAGGGYSLAIAVLCTFLLGRTAQALFSKPGLRQGVQVFLQDKVAATFLPYTIAGIVLIVLGLL